MNDADKIRKCLGDFYRLDFKYRKGDGIAQFIGGQSALERILRELNAEKKKNAIYRSALKRIYSYGSSKFKGDFTCPQIANDTLAQVSKKEGK